MSPLYRKKLYEIINDGIEEPISRKLEVIYDVLYDQYDKISCNFNVLIPVARHIGGKLFQKDLTINEHTVAYKIIDFLGRDTMKFLVTGRNENSVLHIAAQFFSDHQF